MFNPTNAMIRDAVERLQAGYRQTYETLEPTYVELIGQVATMALGAIARSDALYHDVEHTILVTLVGQEILRGKQLLQGNVTPQEWMHFILSLLCHDIGYIKGICQHDRMEQHTYTTGMGNGVVAIAPGCTDASLTPYHVDRGKQFVLEVFAHYQCIQIEQIQRAIELTRFPVPEGELHRDTGNYPGLARAADLIGQLADPRYLEKLPALFYEFEESGTNQTLGYQHPGDLRLGYPRFFRTVVYPLIQPALTFLTATQQGRQIIQDLESNVLVVERELTGRKEVIGDRATHSAVIGGLYHFYVHEGEGEHRMATESATRCPILPSPN